ncbi:MAG TPA: SDR family oxidoreductase [Acidimicrobiales bacterium]|nr:SDR family oxidoreductase [Acidimicrobiales bacterium]
MRSGDESPGRGRDLAGRRVLVVGASAGIGRAFANRALLQGARVVVAARRSDRLSELVRSNDALAVTCDVRNPDDCRRMLEEATSALGDLDLLVYCAGVAPLRPMVETTEDDWASVLETHVLGLHHTIQAAMRHLSESGVIAVLSSETVGKPRPGLGAYGASKAALEECVRAWRLEHPSRRLVNVAIGATFPTEFGDAFDPKVLKSAIDDWTRHGLMTEKMLDPDDVAGALAGTLASALDFPRVGFEDIVLRPPSPVVNRFSVRPEE